MRRVFLARSLTIAAATSAAAIGLSIAGAAPASATSAAASAGPAPSVAPSSPTSTEPSPPAASTGSELATTMMPADSPDAAPAAGSGFSPRACAAGMNPASDPTQPLGIDIASYQHPGGAAINFTSVAASGQRVVVVKATESTSYLNPYLVGDVNGARAAGMYATAYHFARPEVSPVAQADWFAQAYNSLGGTLLPPVLDLENNGGLAPAGLVAWVGTFLVRLQADTGRVPMIYTGPAFWNSSMAGSTAFTNYPLWVAHYTPCAQPQQFGGWANWTFWQFSDGSYNSPTPNVPGISANVDRDRVSGGEASLASLAVGPFSGTASRAQFPDGTYVNVAGTPAVYVIAGLSPIYVSSWANVGGVHPVRTVTAKTFSTLRANPAEGTFLLAKPANAVYRVVGGAPVYVTSFAPFGNVPLAVVDSVAVDNAGRSGYYAQLRATPADGAFMLSLPSGAVYRAVGGAAVYVSSWAPFGNQTFVTVNDGSIDNAGSAGVWSHLNARPAQGTFVQALPSGAVYQIVGGAPVYVSSWAPFGNQTLVTVNDAVAANAGGPGVWGRLSFRPAEGTFLNALPSGSVYRVDANGVPVYVPSWAPYGGVQPYVDVNDAAVDNHGSPGVWAHLA